MWKILVEVPHSRQCAPSFYRPSRFDVTNNIASKFSTHHHFGDGLNFFEKSTNSQFSAISQEPVPLASNRFRFREIYGHQQESQVNDLFLKNLENSQRNDRSRYNPYSSASKNHRLNKILYKSVTNIEDLSPIPNKYAGFSIKDKLAYMKKTIDGWDITNLPNKENKIHTTSAAGQFRHLDSNGLSTILTKSFNPSKTSTPMPGMYQTNNSSERSRPFLKEKKEEASKIVSQAAMMETPSSSRKESSLATSECIKQEKPSVTSMLFRPFQQWWRGKKYNDEQEDRKKEAQRLEKEVRLREKSRHNRELIEEEDRRVRLQLEGLVLERRVPPKEEFPELSNAAKQSVKIIWSRSEPFTKVFVSGFGADITRKDLLTLHGSEWLNDEVINFFLNLIVERNSKDPNLPNVYTFNTFFYQKLQTNGFAGVKRWTRKVDIFSYEILIVPVHLPNHWCMAVIDLKERKVDYYDSMSGSNETCLQLLSDYLGDESIDKRKQQFSSSGWTMECRKDIPRQSNFSDCGMFSCLFAEYASRRAPITFTQKHISYFRERMCYEIYQKKLLD
uniref:Ubiquitin-like protease family profile domain-containing protein n=1 Tax=Globodera rostochiensis TaxID=31243 RepID=A0A914IDI0_GLORO